MTSGCPDAKDWAVLLAHAWEVEAALGASRWFWVRHQFQPRVKFDLECTWIRFKSVTETYLVKVALICENKGALEHRLFKLSLSIHGLCPPGLPSDGPFCTRPFGRSLIELTNLVPPRAEFYFLPPGVRKVITHQVVLIDPGPLLLVTAGFSYGLLQWRHTACRVFALVTEQARAATTRSNTGEFVPLTGAPSN